MDFFGILTYLNSIGLPVPLCVILAAYASWMIWLHRRVLALENSCYAFVEKEQLKYYIRSDTFSLRIKNANMESRLGESLNSVKIDQLDSRTTALEKQVNKLRQIVSKICRWIKSE